MPAELQTPLAVAQHLLEAATKAPEPSGTPEEENADDGIAPNDTKEETTETVSTPTPEGSRYFAIPPVHGVGMAQWSIWIRQKQRYVWWIQLDGGQRPLSGSLIQLIHGQWICFGLDANCQSGFRLLT